MEMKRKQKKFTSVLAALLLITALALLLTTAGSTLAKYIRKDQNAGAAVPALFYFTSDLLGEPGEDGRYPYYQIDDPGEGRNASITFTLSNYVDSLRCTDSAIEYSYATVTGSQPGGEAAAGMNTSGEGTLAAGGQQANRITMNVARGSFGSEEEITVTVTTTEPFQKTIGARFGFTVQEHQLQWVVEEEGSAVVLELSGGNGGEVTVTWPSGLFPDLSSDVFRGASSGQVTFAAQPGARYALTFLKPDPNASFPKEVFTVTAKEPGE